MFMKFLLFIVSLSLLNCSKKKPEWFSNPPISQNIIYGTGVSNFDCADSRKNALNDVASQIKVNLSSKFENNVYENSAGFNAETNNVNLNIKNDNIEITNYRIENQELIEGVCYTLISIERDSLKSQTKATISSIVKDLDILQNKLIKDKDLIKQVQTIKEIKVKVIELQKNINLMLALDTNYNGDFEKEKINSLKDNVDEVGKNIYFNINCEEQELKDIFLSSLTDAGYNVISDKNGNGINIFINTKFTENELYGYYIIESNITLLFSNAKKGSTYQKTFTNRASSVISFEKSKAKIYENIKQQIPSVINEFLNN